MAKRTQRKKSAVTAGGRLSGGDIRPVAGMRIIGGRLGGRRLHYTGDFRTRPMKDRLREAVFNLLGTDVRGKHALDLFAGTGALGLEAISRGAARATLLEQHHPTAAVIRQNIAELGLEAQAEVVPGNTFIWWHKQKKSGCEDLLRTCATAGLPSSALDGSPENTAGQASSGTGTGALPWAVFCSPPYDFYVERIDDMLELLGGLLEASPAGSVFLVEADDRFDFQQLPDFERWDVRSYPPAVVGVYRRG
jgi:16S rRNA G966 N2-methylase RsmD